MLPSAYQNIEYKRAVEIDFTSPKTLKAKLDCTIDMSKQGFEPLKAKRQKVSCFDKYITPTQPELDEFYTNLSKYESMPGLLSIVYIPKLLNTKEYPQFLPNLVTMSYAELIQCCSKLKITISQCQQSAVEKATKMQASSRDWFQFRAGRLTASNVYRVCHTDIALPSQSLIMSICYPESYKFSSAATSWGCEHEKIAREMYESDLKTVSDLARLLKQVSVISITLCILYSKQPVLNCPQRKSNIDAIEISLKASSIMI